MELAARLQAEARACNERRVLVLSGSSAWTRETAIAALQSTDTDPCETSYVGPDSLSEYESLTYGEHTQLLGTTRTALVLDCHQRCEPNVLGQVVGTVDGGGLFVLLTPPLDSWPERRDVFDETLAVLPYTVDDVGGHFRTRLVETIRAHRGIALVTENADTDSGTVLSDGLTSPSPRYPAQPVEFPDTRTFPDAAYEACLTQDQLDALTAFERLTEAGNALVVESDRGRGKSSVAGLAAASLALTGKDILVTAPAARNTQELFARATELFESVGCDWWTPERDQVEESDAVTDHETIFLGSQSNEGSIRFQPPADAIHLPAAPDRVIVDEAAALPVDVLETFLDADGVAFLTTIHGYEGTGQGFTVRFRERLTERSHAVTDVCLTEPIRYAAGDPIEVWSFRALCLDARPPVDPLVTEASPETVEYRNLTPAELRTDEQLLREVFGLLVLAHYRTEPNDLARLLDAPNVSTHALFHDGHPVSVALLAREGGLPTDVRARMYEGRRIRGHMLPDVLTGQLRDEDAAEPVGYRVLRIATHRAVRSRGLGSTLLDRIRTECRERDADWLGTSYGATPRLVSFWGNNGFSTVHLSTSVNQRSGLHSALMLAPLSSAGETLLERHSAWFLRRFPSTLTDSLSDADPDVIRGVCRTTAASSDVDLTPFEWRIALSLSTGTAIFDTAPRPVRRLTLRYLTDDERESLLSPREERLLVSKALQGRSWETVAEELSFYPQTDCMRTLGSAVDTLVDAYGDETVQRKRERME